MFNHIEEKTLRVHYFNVAFANYFHPGNNSCFVPTRLRLRPPENRVLIATNVPYFSSICLLN